MFSYSSEMTLACIQWLFSAQNSGSFRNKNIKKGNIRMHLCKLYDLWIYNKNVLQNSKLVTLSAEQ